MKSAGNETATKQPAPLTKEDLLRSPASFLALGFGTGLARIAPGTFGTLPGVLICALLAVVPASAYVVLTVVIAVVGVWICDRASAELGVHDHGGIVWDEIAGYLVTMIAIPVGLITLVAGFVLFRLFDIWKPWPISWLDKHVDGGAGIMVDDVVAGLLACGVLHLLLYLFPGVFIG
jgi:phosphatidylglycerophosphatase A